MHDPQRLIDLLNTYTKGQITPEERSELFSYILMGEYEDLISEHVQYQLENTNMADVQPDLPAHSAQEIIRKILFAEERTAHVLPQISSKRRLVPWLAAASALIVLAVAAWLFPPQSSARRIGLTAASSGLAQKSYNRTNTTDRPQKFQLEDGTVITLQPGSRLDYPTHFVKDRREVVLDGEASFDVSRNAHRPFYVYDGDLVTHVLGTSFDVRINKKKDQIEIAVHSGKVEVYERSVVAAGNENNKLGNGVILTPNQKVVYAMDSRQFKSSIVDEPMPIIRDTVRVDDSPAETGTFVYNAARLSEILQSIKDAYGIEIEVENDNINNCLFTGDISTQNLYEKLDILCQALKDSYEVKGTRILIRGKGCY